MEIYAVTVWDVDIENISDSGSWTMESPPVRVKARDSYDAALIVARRGNPGTNLGGQGIARPPGIETGMYFQDAEMGLVFQVEDTNILRPPPSRY